MIRFEQPLFLLLLIPVAVGLFYSYKHVHGMAKGRKKFAFVLRFLLLGLLIGALAGPESHRPNDGLGIIFVVDRSASVQDADKRFSDEFIDKTLRQLTPKDAGGVVVFGKDAVVEASPGGRRNLGKIASKIEPSASDIAGAVRLASAILPDGKAKRIVVLSDGNETLGDMVGAGQAAGTDGIQIDYVALGAGERAPEIAVTGLHGPTETRSDEPFDLRAEIDSSVAQTAIVALDRDGVQIKKQTVTLNPGRNTVVFTEKVGGAGFHRYRITVQGEQDRDNRNNVSNAFVALKGRSRVLILQPTDSKSPLAATLRKGGIEVDLGGPESTPTRSEDLQNYDALVLNDFNAMFFTEGQMKLIQSAVRDSGIGFAMIGGENSFLPGGYYNTPVAELLPVDLDIRQRKVFPSTTVLVVVDGSGSMAMIEDGYPKIRLAAKASEETVRLLSPRDKLGVAVNTDDTEYVAPIQRLTNKPAVIGQIRKMATGGGGIYMKPSMDFGAAELRKDGSQVRHLIILADGADADMQEGCIVLARKLLSEKITTTIVAIGNGPHVPFLRDLAKAGGGRFYLADKASKLPSIFTQDAAIMARSAIEEGEFYPKLVAGDPALKGIDSTPPLLAYCLTDSRPLASTSMRTHKDDPLFASWQYGLGASMAFTSDAQPRWGAQWVGWQGYTAFWSQAIRAVIRRATKSNYDIRVQNEGGKGKLSISATDSLGYPLKSMPSTVRVAMPDGSSKPVEVTQEAPGKFVGQFDANDVGSYIVTVAEPDPQGGNRVRSSGFSLSYPAEYQAMRANKAPLERMSQASGGKELASSEDALRPVTDPGASITELWQFFVFLAALLLPLDIATRRIALPWSEIFAKVWAKVRFRKVKKTEVEVTVERLHAAKQRVRGETPSARPDVPRVPTVSSNGRPEDREPVAPAASSGGSASEKLLAAKRNRKTDE
jgi:Ca-activated chloride channel family protein